MKRFHIWNRVCCKPDIQQVQIWMEQLREAAQDGISIGIDADGSETEGTEGEDEGSENA